MNETYQQAIRDWRQAKEDELHGDTGWMALAGLFWLKDGVNTLGSDPACDIALPEDAAEPHVGHIDFADGVATLVVTAGAPAMVDGTPQTHATLRADMNGAPSVVWLGRLRFVIIQRGARIGVRLWDHRVDTRAGFAGRPWYPVDESVRVPATLEPADPSRKVPITNILGDTDLIPSPGTVAFTLHGQSLRLVALGKPGALRFYFRDRTSGDTTYPACRFLEADIAADGSITLDFNKAYSPPCAYTIYATCPLPPPENHLPLRIEAGERYSDHH